MNKISLRKHRYVSLVLTFVLLAGCGKEWLNHKNELSLIVPQTLADLRMLLNNTATLTPSSNTIMEASADNYYVPDAILYARGETNVNTYLWKERIFTTGNISEYDSPYLRIATANIVLESLEKIAVTPQNRAEWEDIKGGALFFRAKNHFDLVQLFAAPYHSDRASESPGIPLRLNSSLTEPIIRATVEETYTQIVRDFTEAADLLSVTNRYKVNPTKPAVTSFLARVYLSMRDYANAYHYAKETLAWYDTLLDYNHIDSNAAVPFPAFNEETIYYVSMSVTPPSIMNFASIDTNLYQSFTEIDLRKALFFRGNADGTYSFKGNYTASSRQLFSGTTTAEMLLIYAECAARMGDQSDAITTLNHFLSHRYLADKFSPLIDEQYTSDDILQIVLEERRKELMFRGMRWMDLRRLNLESEHQTTLYRYSNDMLYTLEPNSPRYVFPFSDDIITSTGMPQNER